MSGLYRSNIAILNFLALLILARDSRFEGHDHPGQDVHMSSHVYEK